MKSQEIIAINGNKFSFKPGETILEVAEKNSIEIPTLCRLKGTKPEGACGICGVEVQGEKDIVPSCNTPAAGGMEIMTESPKARAARISILKRLISSGNHNCAVSGVKGDDWTRFQLEVQKSDQSDELCPVWGDCRLPET